MSFRMGLLDKIAALMNPTVGSMLAIILCFFFVLLSLPTPENFLADADWGFQLAGANQIIHGEHPFVDFAIYYGPLTPYVSAFALWLSNMKPIGEILLVIIGYITSYFLLFILTLHITKKISLSLAVMLFGLILIPKMYKYYIVLGPITTLAALWWYVEKPDKIRWFLCCTLVVMTTLYRQDYGVYTFIVGGIVFMWKCNNTSIDRLETMKRYVLSLLLIASPWLIFLLINRSLYNYFYTSLIVSPRVAFNIATSIKMYDFNVPIYSTNNIAFVYLIFFNSLPIIGIISVLYRKHSYTKNDMIRLVSLIILSQLTLFQGLHRTDYSHILQSIVVTIILYGWFAENLLQSLNSNNRKSRILSTVVSIIWLFIACLSVTELSKFRQPNILKNLRIYMKDRPDFISAVESHNNSSSVQIIRFIMDCSTEEHLIFTSVRGTNFYYMANRAFAGGIMSTEPGFLSLTEEYHVIEKLEKQQPFLFVDLPEFSFDGTPVKRIDNYALTLHDYLYKNFIPIRRINSYIVLVNRTRIKDMPLSCMLPIS